MCLAECQPHFGSSCAEVPGLTAAHSTRWDVPWAFGSTHLHALRCAALGASNATISHLTLSLSTTAVIRGQASKSRLTGFKGARTSRIWLKKVQCSCRTHPHMSASNRAARGPRKRAERRTNAAAHARLCWLRLQAHAALHARPCSPSLEALAVHNGRGRLLVFALGDPHGREGGQGRQDGTPNPHRVLTLGRGHDSAFGGGRGLQTSRGGAGSCDVRPSTSACLRRACHRIGQRLSASVVAGWLPGEPGSNRVQTTDSLKRASPTSAAISLYMRSTMCGNMVEPPERTMLA